MCGILFGLCSNKKCRKGGHHDGIISTDVEALVRRGPDYQRKKEYELGECWYTEMYSTVLHMRGPLCPQPIEHSDTGDVLMWNAEIFGGIEVAEMDNDGEVLLNILSLCDTEDDILDVFKQIQGPYAFIFIQKRKNMIWFGRDVFGRRSLTFHIDSMREKFLISSVSLLDISSTDGVWQELAAAGIYAIQLNDSSYEIQCWPWTHNSMQPNTDLQAIIHHPITLNCIKPLNMTVPDADEVLKLTDNEQPLLLASVLLKDECEGVLSMLSQAVYRRIGQHSYFCHSCSVHIPCSKAHIAVMFSGGIDSMMLAYLADKYVPLDQSIDLLNVAFQTGNNMDFDVPDRRTGREALSELSSSRAWNFVEINVTLQELQDTRSDRISSLIQPLDSVLDDSIGCAIWFASRGIGVVRDNEGNATPYTSTARVVLSGLGADEQLGGYSRHRSSFMEGGYEGLLRELNLDVMRISARNLGRDDRVVADHGKEARFPFLDEEFVSLLNQLPVYKKMDLRLPRGIGEKLILRACAIHCNLPITAQLAKRAIQFGSRIAKCENRSEKGSDVCARLTKATKGKVF